MSINKRNIQIKLSDGNVMKKEDLTASTGCVIYRVSFLRFISGQ